MLRSRRSLGLLVRHGYGPGGFKLKRTAGSVIRFLNRDADEVVAFYAKRYDFLHIEPHGRDRIINMKGSFGRLPGIVFAASQFKNGFDVISEHNEPTFFFIFPSAGALHIGTGLAARHEANVRFATASCGQSVRSLRFSSGLANSTLSIEKALIAERLSLHLDQPVTLPIVFEPVVDREKGKIKSLESVLAFLSESAFGVMIEQTPIASKQMSNAIVDLLLEVWPHNFSDSLAQPRTILAPRHVKRAIEYIKEHPSDDVTVETLAAACGISLRALQYGFRQSVGMTIGQYQRQLKLEGARRSLISDPSLSVTDLAKLWNFSNVHRFSLQFEQAFGETPSQMKQRL